MIEKEDAFLVCGTVQTVPGSVTRYCGRCGAAVVVAPSGVELMASQRVVVLCIPCGTAAMLEEKAMRIGPLTPLQRQEVEAKMGGAHA
jgi:hypothetical protein